jgi:hypothetical protein
VFLYVRTGNAGKTILYCTVPAGTAFHLFFWKGRHDAKPLNHKHSASNGYQATVYDKKTRFVTFVETSGNGFDYFSCSQSTYEVLDALLPYFIYAF